MGLNRLAKPVLHLPRPLKRILAIFLDAFLCALTVWLAFYLRLGQWIDLSGNFEWDPEAQAQWNSLRIFAVVEAEVPRLKAIYAEELPY